MSMFPETPKEREHRELLKEFLSFIADVGCHTSLRVRATVNGTVSTNYVEITSAPPKVVKEVMAAYPYSSLDNGRLLVDVTARVDENGHLVHTISA